MKTARTAEQTYIAKTVRKVRARTPEILREGRKANGNIKDSENSKDGRDGMEPNRLEIAKSVQAMRRVMMATTPRKCEHVVRTKRVIASSEAHTALQEPPQTFEE